MDFVLRRGIGIKIQNNKENLRQKNAADFLVLVDSNLVFFVGFVNGSGLKAGSVLSLRFSRLLSPVSFS